MSISLFIATAPPSTTVTSLNHRLSPPSALPQSARLLSSSQFYHLRFCSAPLCTHTDIPELSGASSVAGQDLNGKDEISQPSSSNQILNKLKRYGASGILSYGLLNTVYYLTTFLVVWFYVAPAPGRMGYLAAIERFFKVMAMVWAESQVTKLMRAGGALALAPFVDRGLSWFTVKFGFKSQGKAFATIAGICFGFALLMFVVVTLVSA